jgi:hypothetical protein
MGVRRPRREWEAEYVGEFLSQFYKGYLKRIHVRLGTYPPELRPETLEEEEQRLLRVYLRWADGIAIGPDEIVIVEAKLRPTEYLKALGELDLYIRLLPGTPEFQEIAKGKKIVGHLVVAVDDPPIASLCRAKGFRYTVLKPSFWDEYVAALPKRIWRAPLVKYPE